tara:strand:- start:443 stop:790 length:348 start_codon:yes stop_codon:yes gene_type:complete
MSELILTSINPKDFFPLQKNLVRSIKDTGIKYPVVVESNNGITKPIMGFQRALASIALGINEIDAVLWSKNHTTGFNGEHIDSLEFIKNKYKNIEKEPTYMAIQDAFYKLPYPKN